MLFTEEEIEQVTEDAIQFFDTMYGLDFSQSEPNELGQRFFQNATFFPFRTSPEAQYSVANIQSLDSVWKHQIRVFRKS